MTQRIISISTAPYDGYEVPQVMDSMASCGVKHIEPAFIVGYTEAFTEATFSNAYAQQYARWLQDSGLECAAFSSHIDLGTEDAVDVFKGRMDFAARIGANVINTNAADRSSETRFHQNIQILADHAEQLGMVIGLENPGDGSDNLFNTAQEGLDLIAHVGRTSVRLNYDAGNTISHRPAHRPGGVEPLADALLAIPGCVHTHIKDVRTTPDGYFFTALGQGDINCAEILRAIAPTDLNISIELPVRLHRQPNAQPLRRRKPVPLHEFETVIRESLQFAELHLSQSTQEKS